MCGIVGYIGNRNAVPILVKGLEGLAYRGYDSAGIACLNHQRGSLFVVKEKGKLSVLKQQLEGFEFDSHIGVGHTRWATHGKPSRANAHPHTDSSKRIALVHNGIIENYATLKKDLKRKGYRFASETDTEVAVNLISSYYKKGNLAEAIQKAVKKMEGFYSFVLMTRDEPDKLYVFKRANPLVIGLGHGENFAASDVSAILPYTNRVLYLEDDEYAVITNSTVDVFSVKTKARVKRQPTEIHWSVSRAQKGGYPHFMLKEIFEQPRVLEEAISKRLTRENNIHFDSLPKKLHRRLKRIKRTFLVSCGTAYHAGMVGSIMMEEFARLSSRAEVSSEFRYSDPILNKDDLVILITQSGETADTLAALREAKGKGALTIAVVNVVGSTIAREADAVIYTHAGPEIGVASTKAYIAQLATLVLFTLYVANIRKKLSKNQFAKLIREFRKLPGHCKKILKQVSTIERCARKHYHRRNFLFLGRGYNFPTALEGSLKLKEISYAHAHGYAAGEMKHGPIALIDHEQLVICLAPESKTYDKMISNIEEIHARGGIVITIATEGNKGIEELAEDNFVIPKTPEVFSSMLTVIPLQFFAYKIAVLNGRDVDQPRNLAKSVTVE